MKPKLKTKETKDKMISMRIKTYDYEQLKRFKKELGASPSDVLEYGIQCLLYEMAKQKKKLK